MPIKIITVKSPEDILYPCGKELFEDPCVVYHGTSTVYAETIERDGWKPNCVPYDMLDVQDICRMFESFAFYGTSLKGYPVLKACTLGNGTYNRYKPVSFSENYWHARFHAVHPGGESVDNIIFALNDLERLLRNKKQTESHKRSLKRQFKNSDNHVLLKSAFEHIENGSYLNRCLKQSANLKQKYNDIYRQHQPVVYAVRVDTNQCETRYGQEWNSSLKDRYLGRGEELRPKRNIYVSCESIEVRIDFPKGANWWLPYTGEILPLPWTTPQVQLEEFLEKHRRTFGPEAD